ncbi:uncharacterized protein CTRU02_214114 [Colletotrichum truncatum]|uniref:Uncharacterized protein n=1 Tax=Colletotrichum truncatum TaxID=5467 RepID=A0ACC3YHP7_COLTU|nr:uncharacterized protein CTRU02_06426 [Colletotrichum truncatum]KAF6792929.1 hypothetical protein CTRU02_06426 [Colletotrichum truncatum]
MRRRRGREQRVEGRGSRVKPLGCVRLFQKRWRRVVADGDWAVNRAQWMIHR